MPTPTETEALTVAIFALNALEDPQGCSPEGLAQLGAHGVGAIEVLDRLRDRSRAQARCAGCGWLISAGSGECSRVQIVDDETGQFEHARDLLVCNHCPHVIRAHTAAAARRNQWTRGGAGACTNDTPEQLDRIDQLD